MLAASNSTNARSLGQTCIGAAQASAPPASSRGKRRVTCDLAGNIIGSNLGRHLRLAAAVDLPKRTMICEVPLTGGTGPRCAPDFQDPFYRARPCVFDAVDSASRTGLCPS
jgi:hypothetical protein